VSHSHWWVVESEPVDGAYAAKCRKCASETSFPSDTGDINEFNIWISNNKGNDAERADLMESERLMISSGLYHKRPH